MQLLHHINQLGWFFYRLTPKGKKAYTFKKGLEGLRESNALRTKTKANVITSAFKKLKQKKILAFHKGNSISKSKKTDHQVIKAVSVEHAEELRERGLKISYNGKFKNE